MNVYAAADLHGNLFDVPDDCEVLLLAGDICPDGSPERQGRWLADRFEPWVDDLDDRGVRVVATWGNHDFIGEQARLTRTTFLVDEEMVVRGGLHVWGSPWVPNLPNWAFYGDDLLLSQKAELIPEGLDILMLHGPPYHAGDQVTYGERVGNFPVSHAILRAQPKVVICGHIHEDRGIHRIHGVPVYNVAAVDENYEPYRDPFVKLREF